MLVELLTFCFLLSSLNIQAIFFYGFNSPAIPAAELPTTMINCSALQSSIQALCEQQVQKTSDLCEREQRLRGRPVFVLHWFKEPQRYFKFKPKERAEKEITQDNIVKLRMAAAAGMRAFNLYDLASLAWTDFKVVSKNGFRFDSI